VQPHGPLMTSNADRPKYRVPENPSRLLTLLLGHEHCSPENIVALSPADRAVVIIGQGHEYLLREFVRLNPNLRDVDPLQYLNT